MLVLFIKLKILAKDTDFPEWLLVAWRNCGEGGRRDKEKGVKEKRQGREWMGMREITDQLDC